MSDEEILPCVMCDQHHEQMLMLTCMHDPCINCAAVHYCSTQPSNSNVCLFVIIFRCMCVGSVGNIRSLTHRVLWNCREFTTRSRYIG